jgi:RNA exonuclease 4
MASSYEGSAEKNLSIDVECVATGYGHNDRAPCWIAIVNETGSVLFDGKINVGEMVSPLTEVTGVTREMLNAEGQTQDAVFQKVRSYLHERVVLVGQAIGNDIEWLGLEKGVHYSRTIDLAEEFKSWNKKYQRHDRFSLAQAAFGLCGGLKIQNGSHSPIEDAQIPMRLYREWVKRRASTKAANKLQITTNANQEAVST